MRIKLILLCMLITACGQYTGKGLQHEECINGVVYYNPIGGGIAPAFKADGTLYTCEVR